MKLTPDNELITLIYGMPFLSSYKLELETVGPPRRTIYKNFTTTDRIHTAVLQAEEDCC